ncbi:hypothetical protein ACF0H5_006228 [Mactra antiquata]
MLKLEGTLIRVMYDSLQFFRNTRYAHIVLAILLVAIGTTGAILSEGSNGSAQIPYFFSAFIAAAWHISFVVICQICMYYLADNGSRSQNAPTWVRCYSVSSSLFVLFNVMGTVFTVVNGMCIEDQMCYYDKNITANRMMAITLILLHCVSIVLSVFLAKRTHLIDSQLNTDIGIKLNHVINFLRKRRNHSVASIPQSDRSESRQTTPSQESNQTDTGLSEVHSKGGHVLTTIEISAMAHRKTHRRSKSQPNMVKQLGLQKPENLKGQVFSIYSDTETAENDERERKKRKTKKSNQLPTPNLTPHGRSKSENQVDSITSDNESFTGSDKPIVGEGKRKHSFTQSVASNHDSIFSFSSRKSGPVDRDTEENLLLVKSVGMDETDYNHQKLLLKQEKLQKQQEKLLEEQSKLFLAQKHLQENSSTHGAPPPYNEGSPSNQSSDDNQTASLRGDVLL